jgi:hypothetical protein
MNINIAQARRLGNQSVAVFLIVQLDTSFTCGTTEQAAEKLNPVKGTGFSP